MSTSSEIPGILIYGNNNIHSSVRYLHDRSMCSWNLCCYNTSQHAQHSGWYTAPGRKKLVSEKVCTKSIAVLRKDQGRGTYPTFPLQELVQDTQFICQGSHQASCEELQISMLGQPFIALTETLSSGNSFHRRKKRESESARKILRASNTSIRNITINIIISLNILGL